MQKIKFILMSLSLVFCFSVSLAPALVLADAQSDLQSGADAASGASSSANSSSSLQTTITDIVNLLSLAGGIIAVIMIIVGGLRMVTSAGSEEAVKSARNTIIYSVAGLAVIVLAQVIVRFVVKRLTS